MNEKTSVEPKQAEAQQEITITPFSPKNLEQISKIGARYRKYHPVVVVAVVLMNLFLIYIAYLTGQVFMGIVLCLLSMVVSFLSVTVQKVTMLRIERDLAGKLKACGTFKITEKKTIYSQKSRNRYQLILGSPEAMVVEVQAGFWDRAQEGDMCYVERSLHYGLVFQFIHQEVEATDQVIS